jgi:hypothetical protein
MKEVTAIVLQIDAARTQEFEALFQAEEIPIWDDYTARGRFLEAMLIKSTGGGEGRPGIQHYILHVVVADSEAHHDHDHDPRFQAFLEKARQLQPAPPLVWFGLPIFERGGRT